MQNIDNFDSETSKIQPVNLSEMSRHTNGVQQRAADNLEMFSIETLSNTTRS